MFARHCDRTNSRSNNTHRNWKCKWVHWCSGRRVLLLLPDNSSGNVRSMRFAIFFYWTIAPGIIIFWQQMLDNLPRFCCVDKFLFLKGEQAKVIDSCKLSLIGRAQTIRVMDQMGSKKTKYIWTERSSHWAITTIIWLDRIKDFLKDILNS